MNGGKSDEYDNDSDHSCYMIDEAVANVQINVGYWMVPIGMRIAHDGKRVVDCQIDSGSSCNIIYHLNLSIDTKWTTKSMTAR